MSLIRKATDATVRANLGASQIQGQLQSHPHFDRAPLVTEIPNQGFVLATISGTSYIYTRIGQNRFRVAVTAAP